MYSQADEKKARRDVRREALIALTILVLGIGGMVVGLIVRSKLTSIIGLIVGSTIAYACYDLRVAPVAQYRRFVQNMLTGRTHEWAGRLLSVSENARLSEDGVMVLDVSADKEGEGDVSLYWDATRAFPQNAPDSLTQFTCCGRYIVRLSEGTAE
ncbi:MAG: hypothetical protein RSD95_05400 [Clostridia bacterium]